MTRRSTSSTRRRPAGPGRRGPGQRRDRAGRLRTMLSGAPSGALSGLLAGAVALGVAELIAGLTGPAGSPVVAVGGAAIDMTPIPVKDFAIAHFGSHDKFALTSGILVLLAVFAAVIGVLAVHWLAAGPGRARRLRRARRQRRADPARHHAGRRAADPGRRGRRRGRAGHPGPRGAGHGRPGPRHRRARGHPGRAAGPGRTAGPGSGRRRFLLASAGAAAAAAAAGGIGDLLLRRFNVSAARAQVQLPARGHDRPAGLIRHRAAGQRAQLVLHAERQLLPGRHRPGAAAGVAGSVDPADRRHGRPPRRAHLRRPAPAAAHRGRHHAGLRVQRGRRAVRGQRALARRQPARPCSAGPGSGGAPIRSSAARWTA